jgi:hypothetical protein
MYAGPLFAANRNPCDEMMGVEFRLRVSYKPGCFQKHCSPCVHRHSFHASIIAVLHIYTVSEDAFPPFVRGDRCCSFCYRFVLLPCFARPRSDSAFDTHTTYLSTNGATSVCLLAFLSCGEPNNKRRSTSPSLRETLLALFSGIKQDIVAPDYVAPDGTRYSARKATWKKPLGGDATWKEPLGKKVLIVDIDTRKPTGRNQILNPKKLDWHNLEPKGGGLVTNAITNHYLYAMIHGYDYKFFQAQEIKDHYSTWIRPHIFRELIDDYQFIIAMDADVTISHLEVPLEWMFNRWEVSERTSMAMPWDTEEFRDGHSISTDSKGLRVLNAGFVVVQNSQIAQNKSTTQDLLEAWRDCTTETRYKGCGEWKEKWSHEQRAFSEYIRYDFNEDPDTIVPIPCDDAMGWPGFRKEVLDPNNTKDDISDCNGNFIRHYTLGKDSVKNAGATGVMQMMSEVIQQNLLADQDELWYKEPKKKNN